LAALERSAASVTEPKGRTLAVAAATPVTVVLIKVRRVIGLQHSQENGEGRFFISPLYHTTPNLFN
jgi:hypothetical protein